MWPWTKKLADDEWIMQQEDYDALVEELRKKFLSPQFDNAGSDIHPAQYIRAQRTLRLRAPQKVTAKEWLSRTLIQNPDQAVLVADSAVAWELHGYGRGASLRQICHVVDFIGDTKPDVVNFKTLYLYDGIQVNAGIEWLDLDPDIWNWVYYHAGPDAVVISIEIPNQAQFARHYFGLPGQDQEEIPS